MKENSISRDLICYNLTRMANSVDFYISSCKNDNYIQGPRVAKKLHNLFVIKDINFTFF
jgi:hypothetical protein